MRPRRVCCDAKAWQIKTLCSDAVPERERCVLLPLISTSLGRGFTAAGFGNRMRNWCDEADLSNCSAHGLRKARLSRLAELGCTDAEIMSISGHVTRKEIDRYTQAARQRRLAENVLRRINAARD